MDARRIKHWHTLFLGFLVMILPFIGLPWRWKNWLLALFGFLIVLFSLAGTRFKETNEPPAPSPQN